jgi:hypothetical protein
LCGLISYGAHSEATARPFKTPDFFDMSHPVDDDPIMASAIGRCSNQWTHAESTLTWIFSSLTKTEITIAVTVFSIFKSTRTQSEVLKKPAKISPFHD